ncbi:alpha/beta fold hydrolase [Chitinophaga sp. SYP-B3965]|uniref:alpha/beta hydrolase family protein n=1 Tax=Chitinophaga sp. SYP-B3965 TaxID=2663120 RepID=UPI001299A2DA|nr:alpha/beta fold hydrolase [Chitinophaga sp. SYP-B3965]MRG47535.1 alpha/beta fold hydrolase [Chitinophaga sp. SYP-B3965]
MKRRNFIKGVFIFILSTALAVPGISLSAQDPFAKYQNSIPVITKVISEDTTDNIITRKVVLSSRNGQNAVYAIIASPLQAGKYPGILFLHGGGSNAEGMRSRVEEYAKRGYITLAPDLPGICGNTKVPYSSGTWKTKNGEAPRFDLSEGPQSSTLADAIIAGLEAFNLLSAQPNMDVKNIGITGFSWGGYSTTMLAGLLEKKVKAAYAVFGCGFYDLGSFWKEIIRKMPDQDRATWLTHLDAGRRAKHIKAPYFIETGTNDTYFWPEAVMATLREIKGTKNHAWVPNFNHVQGPNGSQMQQLYFDHYLKGIDQPFGKIQISRRKQQADGTEEIYISVNLPSGIQADSVKIYYSDRSANWQARTWLPLPAQATSPNTYKAVLPSTLKNIDFYAYMKDSRNVVLSSLMYEAGR